MEENGFHKSTYIVANIAVAYDNMRGRFYLQSYIIHVRENRGQNIYLHSSSLLKPRKCLCLFYLFFFNLSVGLLSALRGHSGFSSPPQRPMTPDFEGFSIPDFIRYIYLPILIFEIEPVFHFLMLSAKQLPGTIFITSLV